MSYIFTRHSVETFEVIKIRKEFMKYDVFSRVRKDKPNCELCGKAFAKEDNTNLAFIKGKKNHLICDSCTETAINGGAYFT